VPVQCSENIVFVGAAQPRWSQDIEKGKAHEPGSKSSRDCIERYPVEVDVLMKLST
jgi:hypothetical protein